MKTLIFIFFAALSFALPAEITEIDGQKFICKDGMCMPLEEEDDSAQSETTPEFSAPQRMAHGYMNASRFIDFLENRQVSDFAGKSWWLIALIALLSGLAMNLTPCVLPMIPVNLMIIGRSARRGALYGAGIAIAYGTLGILAAVGGMAFGEIQGNAWFNGAVALVFLLLALSMSGAFFIDLSKPRNSFVSWRSRMLPGLFAFFMGVLSAVLAGACVAPILIATLLLTADLFTKGCYAALLLPLAVGIGMALPWPFAGAGLRVLPKPGAWMKKVNLLFGAVMLGFAAWYAHLAYIGFKPAQSGMSDSPRGETVNFASPSDFTLSGLKRPILVDCWASWCKNCSAMDAATLADEKVKAALKRGGFTLVKLQAENIAELRRLPGFENVRGLPAFLIFE